MVLVHSMLTPMLIVSNYVELRLGQVLLVI